MKTPLLGWLFLVLFRLVHYTQRDLEHNIIFQVRRCTHGDETGTVSYCKVRYWNDLVGLDN